LFDFDLAEVGQIVEDALPFEGLGEALGAALVEPVDQLLSEDQSQEGAEDVATDGRVGLVEDRSGLDSHFKCDTELTSEGLERCDVVEAFARRGVECPEQGIEVVVAIV